MAQSKSYAMMVDELLAAQRAEADLYQRAGSVGLRRTPGTADSADRRMAIKDAKERVSAAETLLDQYLDRRGRS